MPVVIGPGQMQFTVMPSQPSSTASERVNPTTPAFAAEYGLCNAVAPSASVEAMLTIRGDFDLQVRQRRADHALMRREHHRESLRPRFVIAIIVDRDAYRNPGIVHDHIKAAEIGRGTV